MKQGAAWRFDTAVGKEEIIARRIGRNDLNVIQVCQACVDSQREHARLGRDGAGGPTPYHDLFYRILTAQGPDAPGGARDYLVNGRMIGAFAMVACPGQYGVSGVMTFIVTQNSIVYQRDLGRDTPKIAQAMKPYNPDAACAPSSGWPGGAPASGNPDAGGAVVGVVQRSRKRNGRSHGRAQGGG